MMNKYGIIIEALQITALFYVCAFSTYSDLKAGIIKNKMIVAGGIFAIALDIAYYGAFGKELLWTFMLNTIVLCAIAIIFYALHIWAAGDSKLMIVIILLVPCRLYYFGRNSVGSVYILLFTFILAYLYILIDSIVIGVKQKNIFEISRPGVKPGRFLFAYIRCIALTTVVTALFALLLPNFYSSNAALMNVIKMITILVAYRLDILEETKVFVLLIVSAIFLHLLAFKMTAVHINLLLYVVVAVIYVLRLIMEKYNYDTIPTSSVEEGMILAYPTVILFTPSRIAGLPKTTTEDLASRLTSEEVASIKRWENSKYGFHEITIVRKIPFASFISLGTLIFVIIRMVVI